MDRCSRMGSEGAQDSSGPSRPCYRRADSWRNPCRGFNCNPTHCRARPGANLTIRMADPENQQPAAVLTFAASDPSGGAGLQADVLTLASMGCHPLSVVTAITVQDTVGVESFLAMDPDWVADQARCILEDIPVAAFKIGMLGSTEIVTVIAEVVSDYPDIPLVLDPVFASGRGDEFAGDDMVAAIRELLVPQSTVITPNTIELRRLAQEDDDEARGDQLPLPPRRPGALGLVEAPPRHLSRLGLHAGIRDCRQSRPRPGHGRGCPGGAGLHLAGAAVRVPPWHGPVHPGSAVLGTRGSRRW
jgi:hypothetical protein